MKDEGRVTWRQCNTRDTVADDHGQAQREVRRRPKISIITILLRRAVSEIKLKRTDTTLDLSQKAKRAKEKKKKTGQKLGSVSNNLYSSEVARAHCRIADGRT